MAAVGTCVEQPTERQGTIQSASTTHTRKPHHARQDRYRLEARSTAVRKNAQSYLTRCGAGAMRAETASTPHTTDAGELALIHFCIRAKKRLLVDLLNLAMHKKPYILRIASHIKFCFFRHGNDLLISLPTLISQALLSVSAESPGHAREPACRTAAASALVRSYHANLATRRPRPARASIVPCRWSYVSRQRPRKHSERMT